MRKTKREKRPSPSFQVWPFVQNSLLLLVGAVLAAFSYVTFLVPHNIAAGGLSGVAIIINFFTGWPVGILFWIMNMPMMVLGYFQLGRWPFVIRTLVAATLFAVLTDVFTLYLPDFLPQNPLTADLLLSSIYGGIVGGIAGGLVYRSGSTFGGTAVLGRVVQQRTGMPLSQVYFMTDGLIVLAAGIVFGWEIALYAFLVIFLNGLAADYTLEGPSSTRTATIITNQPEEMAEALIEMLNRGVSYWPVTGGYTGQQHYVVLCTVYRSQVNDVKRVVSRVDPDAFLTIGISHQALGKGFKPLPKKGMA